MSLTPEYFAPLLVGHAWFALIGFGPKVVVQGLLFWGSKKRAQTYDAQVEGLRGLARFFFWTSLVTTTGYLAVVALISLYKQILN